jgi:uncharacterized protein (DUF2141 family)
MKRFAAALVAIFSLAATVRAAELTVTVGNIRSNSGTIRLAFYISPDEWPDNSGNDYGKVVPAKRGQIVLHFDLPPGVYAINGFHDENGNGKFDTNFLGIPKEGYIFSNDARPVLSAPSFDSAAFRLPPQGAAIIMHVKY